jgi:hypothetical protein
LFRVSSFGFRFCEAKLADLNSTGSVPDRESAALGHGRKSHTPQGEKSSATRMVS